VVARTTAPFKAGAVLCRSPDFKAYLGRLHEQCHQCMCREVFFCFTFVHMPSSAATILTTFNRHPTAPHLAGQARVGKFPRLAHCSVGRSTVITVPTVHLVAENITPVNVQGWCSALSLTFHTLTQTCQCLSTFLLGCC
jgi:hypothetical protein